MIRKHIHSAAPTARRLKGFKGLALACVLFDCVFAVVLLIVQKINDRPYQNALKLFDEGKYQESILALEDIWLNGSTDVVPLENAIIAFREYYAGDVKKAHRYLELWSDGRRKHIARYLPPQYEEKILDFQAQVNNEYDQIVAEEQKEWARQQELERQRYQQEMAEAQERLKDQWPYIGMPESYISFTCLGGYAYFSDIDRYDYPYRVYIYKDAKGRETFSVTCKNHVVTDVWDKLNNRKLTENNTWKNRVSNSPSSSAPDPYNAKDYTNEEDFYYDHWNDFFDYYQAEEYWQEHQETERGCLSDL